jgi:hypothetical protein
MPETGRGGLRCCEVLKIPICLDDRLTAGGEMVSLMRRQPFSHTKIFWYSFLLQTEQTLGPSAAERLVKLITL